MTTAGYPPPAYAGTAPPPTYGGYGYPPQAPGPYGPSGYGQPAGVPPVYTCSAPAQPYYQQQPQQPMAPTYYVNTPPPAAYPYAQQEVPMKPEVLGKHSAVPGGVTGQDGADLEDGSMSGNAITPEIDVSIRHAFVRKVYCILCLQLLMTFGLATSFSLCAPMASWLVTHWWIALVGGIVSLVCSIVISCFPAIGRRYPLNFLLLTVITAGFAMVVCLGAATTSSYAFFLACGITSAVVLALTLFAIQVKYDFTGWGPYLLVAIVVLCLFGILCAFFRSRVAACAYAGISAIVISFLLVYDTQQVVGGKHRKYQYSVDDYIFAALTLYLDIVTLFMDILTLIENA